MDSTKNTELDDSVFEYGKANYRKGIIDGILVGVIISFFMVAATRHYQA